MARGFERRRRMRALGLATLGAAVASAAPASADIVSSGEVNLGVNCEGGDVWVVDLDGDGTDDFSFWGAKCCIWVSGELTATWVEDDLGYPERLSAGELINNSLPFSPGSGPLSAGLGGNWNGSYPVTGYIGVGFMIGAEVHYGWIEYTEDVGCDGTVVQWAYDDIPGAPKIGRASCRERV